MTSAESDLARVHFLFVMAAPISNCLSSQFLNVCRTSPVFRGSLNLFRKKSGDAWSASVTNDPKRCQELNREARIDLAVAYRALDMLGLGEGVCNHLSLIAPSQNRKENVMLLIPHGLHWSEVTASSLVGLNREAKIVEGDGEAELSAASIHVGVHRMRPDANCVMHIHPPYATALSCLKDQKLLMTHQNSLRFYKNVAYDREYSGLANAIDEGMRLGKVLGDNEILVMGNHGILSAMPTVPMAFDHLYYFERAAMFQVLAYSAHKELEILSERQCEATYADSQKILPRYSLAFFNAMKRILTKRDREVIK